MSSAPARNASRRRSRRQPARWSDWARIATPVALLVGFVIAGWQLGYFELAAPDALHETASRARGIPWLAPMFVGVYATLAALACPVSPLAYGAGAVFGVVEGSIVVWTASMIGSAAGYTLARTAWAEAAHRLLGRHEDKLKKLQGGNTFLRVLRVQLLPIPFGLLIYAAGTARLPFLAFWSGSGLGIIPGTIAAVYVGDQLRAGVRARSGHPFVVAGVVMGAFLLLSFVPTIIAKWKDRKPATREEPPSDRRESLGVPAPNTPRRPRPTRRAPRRRA